jgi:hypothetical protein
MRWSSEEIVVPYVKPIDGEIHRYFPDAYIEVKSPTGVKKFLIEIKPKQQCAPPKSRRKTRRYLSEVTTFVTNQAKWDAATKYANERGWVFLVLTEDHLFGKGF